MIKKMVLNKQKKKNPTKYFWGISICLIFIGSISIGYSYLMYPTLIPIYGGGEQFNLDNYNNYTQQFPFFVNSRLHIIMNANDTVQIFIDNENILNGTYYETEIGPDIDIMMTLKSNSPVNGRFTLRQETPLFLEILSIGLISISVISIIMNLYYVGKKKLEKK
jgi:hypothetical protein